MQRPCAVMAAVLSISGMQLLLLCVVAVLPGPWSAAAQGLNLDDIRRCSFPPKGGNSSSVALPTSGCPRTNATLASAKANAWRFAPQMHFHFLEPYHLQVSTNCRDEL